MPQPRCFHANPAHGWRGIGACKGCLQRSDASIRHAYAAIARAVGQWRRKRRIASCLRALDDALLRDIGVSRGEIDFVAHARADDSGPCVGPGPHAVARICPACGGSVEANHRQHAEAGETTRGAVIMTLHDNRERRAASSFSYRPLHGERFDALFESPDLETAPVQVAGMTHDLRAGDDVVSLFPQNATRCATAGVFAFPSGARVRGPKT